jgi:hypothetical protein
MTSQKNTHIWTPFTWFTSGQAKTEPSSPSAIPIGRFSKTVSCFLIALILFCSGFVFYKQIFPDPGLDPLIQAQIYETAVRYGISSHYRELLAIVEVESKGEGEDIFQSSESAGLAPNTLDRSSSIEQGVAYYASLLEKADELGLDQSAVFQAYNYGSGYLDFVAANGGVHTSELAQEFARQMSQDVTVTYLNPLAIASNGGWRYNYGNMFYADLIRSQLNKQT